MRSLLQRSNLEFQEIEQDGQGDSSKMGSLLWTEAEAHVPVSFEIQLDKRYVETSNRSKILHELPVSEQTRQVLDQRLGWSARWRLAPALVFHALGPVWV